MNGGILIQDLENHAMISTHPIIDLVERKEYEITSTHHQMQYPFNIPTAEWTCLFAAPRRSSYYEGLLRIESVPYEPEIVLYHKEGLPKCLAIQGHPEYMRKEAPIVIKLNELIDNFVLDLNNK